MRRTSSPAGQCTAGIPGLALRCLVRWSARTRPLTRCLYSPPPETWRVIDLEPRSRAGARSLKKALGIDSQLAMSEGVAQATSGSLLTYELPPRIPDFTGRIGRAVRQTSKATTSRWSATCSFFLTGWASRRSSRTPRSFWFLSEHQEGWDRLPGVGDPRHDSTAWGSGPAMQRSPAAPEFIERRPHRSKQHSRGRGRTHSAATPSNIHRNEDLMATLTAAMWPIEAVPATARATTAAASPSRTPVAATKTVSHRLREHGRPGP